MHATARRRHHEGGEGNIGGPWKRGASRTDWTALRESRTGQCPSRAPSGSNGAHSDDEMSSFVLIY